MEWTVGQARQRFSELLRESAEQPQIITNRNRPIAAVVDSNTFQEFEQWRSRRRKSLFDCFSELRAILDNESYELTIPERTSRNNPFPEVLDELSPGHEHRQ